MTTGSKSFLEAAFLVLFEAGEELHYEEITRRALERGLVSTAGRTPHETLNARLAVDIKERGEGSRFVRTAPGYFALRAWAHVKAYDKTKDAPPVRVVAVPTYRQVAAALRVLAGHTRAEALHLLRAVDDLTGSRESPEDWSDPASWIPSRLSGTDRQLAASLWKEGLNPRYLNGPWGVVSAHALLVPDDADRLRTSPAGLAYAEQPFGAEVRHVEEREGILKLLAIVAKHAPADTADLLPDWQAWLVAETNVSSETTARYALRARLEYLRDRDHLTRTGRTFELTPTGRAWLGGPQADAQKPPEEVASVGTATDRQLWDLVAAQKDIVREELHTRISVMDPYALERLVGDLLDAMGYHGVEVTRPSNDKGVDVVGTIEVGITSVREVIQVKRMRGNVQRPVLDALRGSLHRFGAMRGTIITTGAFSPGTVHASMEVGAAPITLIDGRRLVDLLVEHAIGVKKKPVELWELDTSLFEPEA